MTVFCLYGVFVEKKGTGYLPLIHLTLTLLIDHNTQQILIKTTTIQFFLSIPTSAQCYRPLVMKRVSHR